MASSVNLLKPYRSPHKLIRIGPDQDGSYLIPDDLKNIKACFSPGVANRKDFEDILVRKYGIQTYMCDFSSDLMNFKTDLIENMQFFDKKWLDIRGGVHNISLENWVNKYISNPSYDLMLQMDIEGAEYRNLLSTSETFLNRFRILVIELHEIYPLVLGKKENDVELLLKKLNQNHICVHAHPNNCCGEIIDQLTGMNIPRVIELTFLRKDRFFNTNLFVSSEIPHRKDILFNVLNKRPLHLNKKWFHPKKRKVISLVKIIKDNLIWFLFFLYAKYPIKNLILKFLRLR